MSEPSPDRLLPAPPEFSFPTIVPALRMQWDRDAWWLRNATDPLYLPGDLLLVKDTVGWASLLILNSPRRDDRRHRWFYMSIADDGALDLTTNLARQGNPEELLVGARGENRELAAAALAGAGLAVRAVDYPLVSMNRLLELHQARMHNHGGMAPADEVQAYMLLAGHAGPWDWTLGGV